MKERELRLAMVCYGGVSLAIYMHGITKEILKVARASRALHNIDDPRLRADKRYDDVAATRPDLPDTEHIYFDLLNDIGQHIDLRVVIDIIAGASAGGVNGVVLGRALAHDLTMEPVTNAWLVEGDVERLMTSDVKAGNWSKFYLTPFIRLGMARYLKRLAPDEEMRGKLSMFLRSRWFKPPFDGPTLANMYYTAIADMGSPTDSHQSLLPAGQHLNVFLTVTDFYGHTQMLKIHDPAVVREREHRHVLSYDYVRWPNGEMRSEFDSDHLPGIIFGARASSSFPGAFPPATIAEIDRLVVNKGRNWVGREAFIDKNFQPWQHMGPTLPQVSFIDGSVLNNKPFAEAIQAIGGRPAYREVDRRLVYIDPKPPIHPTSDEAPRSPGFFEVIRGALSDLPRSQPIRDDLSYMHGYNERIKRVKALITSARPRIETSVRDITGDTAFFDEAQLSAWTRAAHEKAEREVGLFYDGYLELKLSATIDYLKDLVCTLAKLNKESDAWHWLREAIDQWARNQGFDSVEDQRHGARKVFLSLFDLGYRDRRLRFVIRGLNLLYGQLGQPGLEEVGPEDLDALKGDLYTALNDVRRCQPERYRDKMLEARAAQLVAAREDHLNESQLLARIQLFMTELGDHLNLTARTAGIEMLLAKSGLLRQHKQLRQAVLTDYVGYPFWDVLTFSVTNWRTVGEYDEIRVDRISPEDCTILRKGGAAACLKGIEFNAFGAFFSRAYRENDYLWGRLHATERLIDIIASAAPEAGLTQARLDDLKKRAFEAILAAEETRLSAIDPEFARIRAEISAWQAGHHPATQDTL